MFKGYIIIMHILLWLTIKIKNIKTALDNKYTICMYNTDCPIPLDVASLFSV